MTTTDHEGHAMSEPLRITVVRYQCPHCPTRRANKGDARAHMARCWFNPTVRSCKTCALYNDYPGGEWCIPGQRCNCNDPAEWCAEGVDLSGGLPIGCPSWEPSARTTTPPTTKDTR